MNHVVKIGKLIKRAKIQGAKVAMRIEAEGAGRVVLVVIREKGLLSKIAIYIFFQRKKDRCSIQNIIAVRKRFLRAGVQA